MIKNNLSTSMGLTALIPVPHISIPIAMGLTPLIPVPHISIPIAMGLTPLIPVPHTWCGTSIENAAPPCVGSAHIM